jgi:hypothetical protein
VAEREKSAREPGWLLLIQQIPPKPNYFRVKMFDGEFTHQGELCSFEVLLARFAIADAALRAIAGIVHEIEYFRRKRRSP